MPEGPVTDDVSDESGGDRSEEPEVEPESGAEPQNTRGEGANPVEVPASASLDTEPVNGHFDHDETDPGTDPGNRSDDMPDNEKILEILGDIKAGQERAAERLDALESREVPEAPEATPEIEASATIDEDALVERVAAAVVASLPTPEPTPEPVADDEADTLRAKIEALEARNAARDAALAALTDDSRVGRGAMVAPALGHGPDAQTQIQGLVKRAQSDGDTTQVLCATVNRNLPDLTLDIRHARGEDGHKARAACARADETLRQICRAAELDGLIGNFDTGWRASA